MLFCRVPDIMSIHVKPSPFEVEFFYMGFDTDTFQKERKRFTLKGIVKLSYNS